MNSMNAPKILPWIARKAGISDELALKLWRRAVSEAEYLTASSPSLKTKPATFNPTIWPPPHSFPGCGVTSPGCRCCHWQQPKTPTVTGKRPGKTCTRKKKRRDRAKIEKHPADAERAGSTSASPGHWYYKPADSSKEPFWADFG